MGSQGCDSVTNKNKRIPNFVLASFTKRIWDYSLYEELGFAVLLFWEVAGWGLDNSPQDSVWRSDEVIQQILSIYNGVNADWGPGDKEWNSSSLWLGYFSPGKPTAKGTSQDSLLLLTRYVPKELGNLWRGTNKFLREVSKKGFLSLAFNLIGDQMNKVGVGVGWISRWGSKGEERERGERLLCLQLFDRSGIKPSCASACLRFWKWQGADCFKSPNRKKVAYTRVIPNKNNTIKKTYIQLTQKKPEIYNLQRENVIWLIKAKVCELYPEKKNGD